MIYMLCADRYINCVARILYANTCLYTCTHRLLILRVGVPRITCRLMHYKDIYQSTDAVYFR